MYTNPHVIKIGHLAVGVVGYRVWGEIGCDLPFTHLPWIYADVNLRLRMSAEKKYRKEKEIIAEFDCQTKGEFCWRAGRACIADELRAPPNFPARAD